jgi:VWFA-related protein
LSSFSRALLAAVVLFAALPGAPAGQQQPPPAAQTQSTQQPQQPQRFRTEANFVRVDAYPMKNGSPVTDLSAADFEVFEDGAPQKIETFEHVVIRPAGPQTERIDPGSQRDMLQAAENPRNRVFVIFLDAPHVMVGGSHNIGEPLIRLINRILGPDDLVGVMTPDMSAANLTLARKTEVTEEQLRKHWSWGTRFGLTRDEREQAYNACYPPMLSERGLESDLAKKMIARKRERATLEALQDLVRYLRAVREERKAILTVTEGWVLYRPDNELMQLRKDQISGKEEPIPTTDPITVGPGGKLTKKDPRENTGDLTVEQCNTDRMRLASMDDDHFFREILDDANRANASFYPIDPRGLPVFDAPIGPDAPPPLAVDQANLRTRLDNMRTLADNTDGLAVMNSNDFDKGLRRISDDLTSYYLLGYYSSNARPDGKYHALKVRVTRPGVDVRARRGYRSATLEEVNAAKAAAEPPKADAAAPVKAAMSALSRSRTDAPLLLHAVAVPSAGTIWIAGEVQTQPGRSDTWSSGATAAIEVTAGGTSSSARVSLRAGERTFLTAVKLPSNATDVDVQARVTPADSSGPPATDAIHVAAAPGAVVFRRGPTTGNRQVPTADLRFTRAERIHLEIPASASAKPGSGRMLDRAGQPMGVPVTVIERTDEPSGQRWIAADAILGSLAPGDYAIEVGVVDGGSEARVITALRVVAGR